MRVRSSERRPAFWVRRLSDCLARLRAWAELANVLMLRDNYIVVMRGRILRATGKIINPNKALDV